MAAYYNRLLVLSNTLHMCYIWCFWGSSVWLNTIPGSLALFKRNLYAVCIFYHPLPFPQPWNHRLLSRSNLVFEDNKSFKSVSATSCAEFYVAGNLFFSTALLVVLFVCIDITNRSNETYQSALFIQCIVHNALVVITIVWRISQVLEM